MFVCTANTLRMPPPLLDRMELIRIPGYTEDEKVEIAKRHLISKQLEQNGIKKGEWEITDEALRDLIRFYTREAGVRSLERELAKLVRKAIRALVGGSATKVRVTSENLGEFSGVRRFRYGIAEEEDSVGVVTGLAWTEVGGELLSIESVLVPGKGKMTITGKLGDVMQESIQAAASFVKSRATTFGIHPRIFEKRDIHIHVPEGAVPKDGPSAGVGMVTSIVSVLTNNPVRKDIAMTGEVTLRGRVFAIGGLKEKLLAALRGGIKTVLIPKDNEKDLAEVPDNVKTGLQIIPVATVEEVLQHALTKPLVPITWEEDDSVGSLAKDKPAGDAEGLVTH
jgi:ATP-dependent Lon protease